MAVRRNLSRDLRAWWATLALIGLFGAGLAYGVTWYTQGRLERDATRDARKLVVESFQPLLSTADVEAPVRGDRYDELLATLREGLLSGPINAVRLWRADGTVLFADTPAMVGERDPEMREAIHSATAGTAEGFVDGDRFRVFAPVHVGDSDVLVAAELDRSHAAIVAEARETWYPWVGRGLAVAAGFAGLYVVTAIFFGILGGLGRRASRREASAPAKPARARREVPPAPIPNLPPYMQPGFQDEVQARREVEGELETVMRERDSLRERVRRLEIELERRAGGEDDGDRPGEVVPLARR